MNAIQSTRRSMLRMTPLARCLAMSLAVAGVASPVWASSPRPAVSRSVPPNARIEPSVLDSWLHEPIDRRAQEDHWRAVLQRPIPALPTNTIPVTNCNDSGSGSLRDAVNNANTGDTIDLTNTGCSVISLTTGAIAVTQADLTLQGPGALSLAVDANHASPVVLHTGGGTLYVNDLMIKNGAKYFTDAQVDAARGGCIFSSGEVSLSNSEVKYCKADNSSTHYGAYGGAIYAQTGVTLDSSSVLGSSAHSSGYWVKGAGISTPGTVTLLDSFVEGNDSYSTTTWTLGGGVYAKTALNVKYSVIDGNSAYSGAFVARGGGLYSAGNLTIQNSTIRGNSSRNGGGVFVLGQNATSEVTMINSTVSGNHAVVTGGIDIEDYPARIANSTIAFNDESFFEPYGAGLFVFNTNVELESTIVSNNYNVYSGSNVEDDVATSQNYSGTLSGSHNLITLSSMTVPPDTIENKYANLGPLTYNGGTTATHKLMTFSPAIDTGSNAGSLNYDQRGAGYPRVIGSNADIGAYELDTADEIFSDGFDF